MKVLLVDDDPVTLALEEELIRRIGGLDVAAYGDPAIALAAVAGENPDLIVVDYLMPEIDGIAFIRAARALPAIAAVPIVMVTAEQERAVRYRALEAGANDFLTKPVDGIEMQVRVRNLLEVRRSRRALEDRASWLADEVAKATEALIRRERETIYRLARAAEYRDNVTGMHIIRMGHYTHALARTLGQSDAEAELLLLAAPMHDVGKVAVPDYILLKPGPLTTEEYAIMRQHVMWGYEILKESESPLLQRAAELALTHHERFDGSGYPRGLRGDGIPLSGRITALADVFDALVSKRPYKEAWPLDRAVEEIVRRSGSHFDPLIVEAFRQTIPELVAIKARFTDGDPMTAEVLEVTR